MSDKFDWQAEDDVDWDALSADDPREQTPRWRWRWPFLLLLMLLLAGASFVVMRRVNQRVEANSQAMRSDIQSSRDLVLTADEAGDQELFISILSGRDEKWTAAQRELFKAGLLQDRAPFGLHLAADELTLTAADEALAIDFAPDMLAAEVTSQQPYAISIGSGLTETVTLLETSVYRLGQERWLLAPPLGEFWGEHESIEGTRLQIASPQRDRELASRLLPDLERKLEEMCRSLADINCPDDLLVELQLSTDPATLAAATQPQPAQPINNTLRVTMPTPTLIGLPIDDAGYQALFRGYAAQMATALITQLTGYNCCQQFPIYQALVEYQLNQLSLKPWPVTAADYERIRDERVMLTDLSILWRSEDADVLHSTEGWRIYTVVDYLLQADGQVSPASLQRDLQSRGSFFGWLNGSFANDGERVNAGLYNDLMRQFWLQAYPQATQSGNAFKTQPPDQDLEIVCTLGSNESGGGQVAQLLRYDISADEWREDYTTANFLFLSPLPGDEEMLVLEVLIDAGQWQTGIWRDGEIISLVGDSGEYSVSFGQVDPQGENLTAYVFPPEGRDADIKLFDLDNCGVESGCASQVVPGIPVWSPDGQHVLFGDEPNVQLALIQQELRTLSFDSSASAESLAIYYGDGASLGEAGASRLTGGEPLAEIAGLVNVGEGHAPFWLDEDTFAYIAPADSRFTRPAQSIVYAHVGEDNLQTLLSTADLLEASPSSTSQRRLFWIHYAMVHPTDPNLLLVTAFGARDRQAYVFTFDRGSREVETLMNAGYMANHGVSISPDGRYVILTGNDVDDPDIQRENMLLQIHDLASGETTPFLTVGADFPPFPSYDWSADGRWLAMMFDDNMIGLYAPQEGALHLVQTAADNCTSPSWINS